MEASETTLSLDTTIICLLSQHSINGSGGISGSFHLRLETHLSSVLLMGVASLILTTLTRQSVYMSGVQCQPSLTLASKRSLSQRNATHVYLYNPYQATIDVRLWFRNKPNKNRVDCSNAYQIIKTILVYLNMYLYSKEALKR